MVDFVAWEKTPRYFRDIVITEKIDGTNAAVVIEQHPFGTHAHDLPVPNVIAYVFGDELDAAGEPLHEYTVSAQSRKRMITPDTDNHGFARWVSENAEQLVRDLGAGRHYGEWWGSGINRGYGLQNGHKVFSLFNTRKWAGADFATPNLTVVPVLYEGVHNVDEVFDALDALRDFGSAATVDLNGTEYHNPEGVCIFHTAANRVFKVTLENDAVPKGLASAA